MPFRHAGDKNFWLDIFRGLKRLGHELRIVSAMVEDVPDDGLPIVRVPPIPIHFRPDQRMNLSHNHLAGTNNYLSKTISLPRLVRAVRRVRSEFRPDVIHFVENYGPAMLALRAAFPRIPMSISAPTYQPNRPLYDLFLEASFASFDTIVPFSDAYQRRLMELRYRPERVRMIRWGIDTERFSPPTGVQREAARKELGLSADALVSFWTGFIQQTTEDDFHAAVKTANLVLDRGGSKFAFLFCLKPEHFKESFRASERPGLRVFGSAEAFHAARLAADVFLSPIQDARSTAAPPLAWLEALAMGIPILTTNIPGSEEAVVDGVSGLRVRSPEAASERLLELASNGGQLQRLREGARQVAVDRYSVDRSLAEYLELWSSLANGPRGRAHPRKSVNPSDAPDAQ